jgi:hypothetical protein
MALPKILENARASITSSISGSRIPLHSWDSIKAMLSFIEKEDILKTVIRSLHTIGAIVEISWLEYEGDSLVEKFFIISNPKWLADLFCTIVTVGGGIVKNGFISRRQLVSLWKQYECDTEPLIQLMEQLDIMVRLDENQFLIPCMLPDTVSETLSFSCKNPRWTFRRSYFMSEEKAVPIGVIGKMIAHSLRWGCVQTIWKEGCIVVKDEICYSVRRQRVRENTSNGQSRVVDAIHILMSSPQRDSSAARTTFMHFRQSISNVLKEFYHISYLEVIPIDDECHDWFTHDDAIEAIRKKSPWITSHSGAEKRVDAFCSDLRVEAMVTNIPISSLNLFEDLGKGAYGVVKRGEVIPFRGFDLGLDGKGKEKEGETIEVAVKILKDIGSDSSGEKSNEIHALVSTNWEIFLMSSIRHVNVVRLLGVCVESNTPLLVMELMKGGDLFVALTDPSHLVKNIEKFSKSFDFEYKKAVFGGSPLQMREALQNEIILLRRSVDLTTSWILQQGESDVPSSDAFSKLNFHVLFEKLLENGELHWKEKTGASYAQYAKAIDEVIRIFDLTISFIVNLLDL